MAATVTLLRMSCCELASEDLLSKMMVSDAVGSTPPLQFPFVDQRPSFAPLVQKISAGQSRASSTSSWSGVELVHATRTPLAGLRDLRANIVNLALGMRRSRDSDQNRTARGSTFTARSAAGRIRHRIVEG